MKINTARRFIRDVADFKNSDIQRYIEVKESEGAKSIVLSVDWAVGRDVTVEMTSNIDRKISPPKVVVKKVDKKKLKKK